MYDAPQQSQTILGQVVKRNTLSGDSRGKYVLKKGGVAAKSLKVGQYIVNT